MLVITKMGLEDQLETKLQDVLFRFWDSDLTLGDMTTH